MDKILSPGRRIWVVVKFDTSAPFAVGPLVVVKFRKFLPAGKYEHNGELMERKRSLVQIYTDPGGMRTVTAASIWFKDPGRTH